MHKACRDYFDVYRQLWDSREAFWGGCFRLGVRIRVHKSLRRRVDQVKVERAGVLASDCRLSAGRSFLVEILGDEY